MKLFKRDNSPYWWYVFTYNGRRYRASTKRPLHDKAGAVSVMNDAYQKVLNRRQLGLKETITLKETMDKTLAEVSGQTLRVYGSATKQLCDFFGENRRMDDIFQEDIDAYVTHRKGQGRKENTIKSDLKAFFRALKRVQQTYKVNTELESPRLKTFVKTRYLSEVEEHKILTKLEAKAMESVTYDKSRDLMILLLDTGVRLMEGVNLDWTDIDMAQRQLEVYRPKTSSLSIVPMTDRVHDMLNRRSNYAMPFEQMTQAIIMLRREIDSVCNVNERVILQRGKATIHSLRDTFATRLVNKGMHLNELAQLLGHTSTAMTEKYSHLDHRNVVSKARELMA